MSSAESRVSRPTVGGRFPKPIQSISCSQLGCSWALPVTDDTTGRYSSPYRYTRVDVGKQSHPFCIAGWESNAFLGTGRGRVCEKRKLSFWADSGLEREEHVCRHTNFQAQTSEKKKKKIPAKAIPQAGYWFFWLSNTPHTFAPRSLHCRLHRHFVPRQQDQEEDTGG